MADGKTHKYVAAGAGAVYTSYLAKNESGQNWLAEVLGGAVGGYFGGLLPDMLEPPISPWHRDVCHSWAAGSALLSARESVENAAEYCRKRAVEYQAIATVIDPATGIFVPAHVDPLVQLLSALAGLFWRFLAGLLNGVAAGYASHLVLDAATPHGLPLVRARRRRLKN